MSQTRAAAALRHAAARAIADAMDPLVLLEEMARLAQAAGRAILTVRRAGFVIERKGDASPVTAADRLAETIITEGLRALTPEWPVVAEEAASEGVLPAPSARFWLVDPLDGTREFAAGRDDFCSCIALIEDGQATLGVLEEAARGVTYAGRLGHGAWREEAGRRRAIAARLPPPEGLVLLDSQSHRDDAATAAFCAGHSITRTDRLGSALKFARLAEGLADLSARPQATMMEWDVAAGQAVLEAAGGRVLDMAGSSLRHGKPGYRQGGFVAWGRA